MTSETFIIIAAIIRALGFIALYVLLGFGPGFIAGLVVANRIFGRGAPTYAQTHEEAKRTAAQHNAQWNPAHERWQTERQRRTSPRIGSETGIPE